jgi:outer membrane protein OmpA-like peptidoglycan-associated protein
MIRIGQLLMRYHRKILIWTAACLAIFATVGFFVVPPILKSVLTKQLTAALHRDVSIREVRVNPFTLSATLRGFTVKEPQGPETFVSFEELYVNLESTSLFRWGVVVKELRLTKPFIRIARRQDESYNFSDLLQGQKSQQSAPAKPLRFSVNNIRVIDGGADFQDDTVQKKHTVRELNVGVPFISNIPSYIETFVQPGLSAVINGTRYTLQGKTKPFAESQETTLDVNITDLDLPYYLAYVPRELLTFAMPSGRLEAKLEILFVRQKTTGQTLAVKGDIGLRELAVNDKGGNPVVRIPALGVGLASVEPLVRKVHLAKVSLQSPELTIRREKTGTTNLEMLLPKAAPAPQADEKAPAPAGESLALDVDEISIAGARVHFSDLFTRLPFKTTLDPIDVKVLQLSNRPDTKGSYTLTVKTEAKEEVALEGNVSLTPLLVEGQIEAKSIPLKKYAPYYRDNILFDIESGKLDLSSKYRYAQGQGDPEIAVSEAAVSVNSLRLKWPEESGDFLRIPTLAIRDTVADVSQRRLTVGSLSTKNGTLIAKRLPNGEVDLQKLTPPPPPGDAQPTPAAPATEPTPWVIMLRRMALDQYAVTLEDQTLSEPITLFAEKIRVNAENLSTAKNTTGKLSLTLLLDQTSTISTNAVVGLNPVRADGRVQVAGVALKRYAPYYKNLVVFDVQEGTLDVSTNYRLSQGKDALDIKLAGLSSALRALRLTTRDTSREFLNIPSLLVKNTGLDLSQREVSVGDLTTERGAILVSRSREGEINLAKLLPRATAATARLAEGPGAGTTPGAPAEPERPWLVKAGAISVNQYQIQVEDLTPSEPVRLLAEGVNLKGENLSTAENQTGKVSLALRLDKGTFSSEGSAGMAPVVADLQLALKDLDVRPFQPYFTDRVKITVTDGRVSTDGHLILSIKEPTGFQAGYTGNITLGKFAAIDKISSEDVLKWESLALRDLSVGYNPLQVRASRVALADFFARIALQPNGRLNLQEILESPEEPKPVEKAKPAVQPGQAPQPQPAPQTVAGAPTDIQIEQVTLQGGHIQFTDYSLKPNYAADLTEIGGRVSGLSSEETSLADLELRGKMNNSAPLEITGKINPLKQDLFVDLRARFTGMDLGPTSPYAGKYVGYTIEKGKLSFDLKYLINKGKLESENKIFIDQFTFGEKVDSPTATSLPVRLGVALLKDRNGEIHLDLPVTGSIDDPKFSIWGIILQVIRNLITKAVTSPFALLGAAFGGGEELQYVEFDPGRATVPAEGAKKLDALAKALTEKPSLKLDITGYVDMEADREGLKQYLLQRKVKAEKLNDLVKKGASASPVDDIIVAPDEYEKYLTLAYRAEKFPKPRNFIGMLKSLPVPEMEKLILTHTEVGEEELRTLASQRANAAKEAILQAGKVDPERLFIIEPKTLAPEKKENLKSSRVEFKIG